MELQTCDTRGSNESPLKRPLGNKLLPYTADGYRTVSREISLWARSFPSLGFYARLIVLLWKCSSLAKRSRYDDEAWGRSSLAVLHALENVGVKVEITGAEHLQRLNTPCVVIGNHMSLLETLVLPCIIQPEMKVTFVVKESLLRYPVFRHVMRSRNPIAVSRNNARQDFRTVLEDGMERLAQGVSIIVFPQTTRTLSFEPAQFNTMGVKLAQKAGVPVVPLALLTHAWENGRYFKDLGKINPSERVRFAFGEPLPVRGRGTDEHQAILRFIQTKLNEWGLERDSWQTGKPSGK
ncbi:MAG: 1-acyl-sn-glycerol-3-phosphate acyltransferase [Deltaproteobacteria bacterium]|nr:1-acyl-sn-glycerol-3-phosphate acyltransferase [Deltaproteobacteria bacterium]